MRPDIQLDDVCARMSLHIDRAIFVLCELTDEAGQVDFEKADSGITAFTAKRMEMRAEIVCDYLCQIRKEAKELLDIQEQLNKEQREE